MKISILIPAYNEEKNIDRCLESVKSQTCQDFEIICVDDSSKDKTLEKLRGWQKIFGTERFKLLSNAENLGITKSLNSMLPHARGKYVARIDASDFWEREKLQKQIDFMEKNPDCGIVGCNYINLDENSGREKHETLPETNEMIVEKIFKRNPFAHSCILARTDLMRNAGGYDEKIIYGQDYDLWLRCLPMAKFHNIQEFLCSRNVSEGISMRKQQAQMWQSIKTRIKYIKKYRYGWRNYFYVLEPLAVIVVPEFIKKIKRTHL